MIYSWWHPKSGSRDISQAKEKCLPKYCNKRCPMQYIVLRGLRFHRLLKRMQDFTKWCIKWLPMHKASCGFTFLKRTKIPPITSSNKSFHRSKISTYSNMVQHCYSIRSTCVALVEEVAVVLEAIVLAPQPGAFLATWYWFTGAFG